MADQNAIDRLVAGLHWLGHDSFRLDTPQGPVYFDPFQIAGGPPATLVLASHDHFDHCVAEEVDKVRGPNTVVVTEADCARKLGRGAKVMKPGDTLRVGDIEVRAVPAYNTDKQFHPKANGWLGFVVTVGGVSLYHAGDTDFIPEMDGLEVDVALLTVSGTYVMTAEQAALAALAIKPRLVIPMHYGAIVGEAGDAQRLAQALEGRVPVRVLPKES